MAQVYGVKSNCRRGAERALKVLGVEAPKNGVDFEVVTCDGGWHWIDIRPEAVEAAGAENTADIEVAACLNAAKEKAELDACKEGAIVVASVHKDDGTVIDLGVVDISSKELWETAPCPATFVEMFPDGITDADGNGEAGEGTIAGTTPAPMVDDNVIAAIYAMAEARATRPAVKKTRGWMAFYEREVEAGRMPPRHLVTSVANMHWQTHFDALHKLAQSHNREGLLGYPLNGKNSYAQDCRRWRDLLVKAVDTLAPAAPVAAVA